MHERNGGWMYCVFVSVEGCVRISSLNGGDKDTHTQTHSYSLSQESSPTGRVCPGLSSVIVENIIKKRLSCFEFTWADLCFSCEHNVPHSHRVEYKKIIYEKYVDVAAGLNMNSAQCKSKSVNGFMNQSILLSHLKTVKAREKNITW